MIDNLLKFQDELDRTPEFDLDGYIDLVAVKKNETSLYLDFQIQTGIDNEPAQLWRVTCFEVREHKTFLGKQCELFKLFENHVLLWSYNQSQLSLTFSQSDSEIDVYRIIGKLHERHFALVDKWIPFDSCFNIHKYLPLENLIASGHGQLAEGAEDIIIGYQEVINELGFKSSYLSSTPKRWDDNKGWVEEDGQAKVLITLPSYIVASKFVAQRIMN